MTKWYRRAWKYAAVLVALLLALTPWLATAGHIQNHETVEVTDSGFNGNPGDFIIEVEQGQLVELTFSWAHNAYPREEHIVVLEGYKLETDKINAQNREATLKFIADKSGTFNFKCDRECEVHDYLQKGYLKVKGSGGSNSSGAAVARTATTLAVSPSSSVTAGEPVTLMATLKDAKGVPVPKAEVHFYVEAEFAGSKGQMEIGKAKTDANGVAFLDYQPTLAVQQHKIVARFEGMGIYGESQQAIQIQEVGVLPAAYTVAPIGLEAIRHWAPMALVVVLLGVWITFGYVLYQVYAIARIGVRR
ncbi:MAG: Ig-like domain repeat protein [Chloroflexi bacterium]|nr:Ig-like domain repeat protein [Chloroflexota bacterium]